MFLAACATQNLAETGISRSHAISIAKSACSGYPDRYSYVDHVEWNPSARHWQVTIEDRSSYKGERFTISRHGHVISAKKFTNPRARRYYDDGRYRDGYYSGGYYGRPYHYYGWY